MKRPSAAVAVPAPGSEEMSDSSPVRFERTCTAVSVSISIASTFPSPRNFSVAPRKTMSSPRTTRITPVAMSRILAYWKILRSSAVSTPSPRVWVRVRAMAMARVRARAS